MRPLCKAAPLTGAIILSFYCTAIPCSYTDSVWQLLGTAGQNNLIRKPSLDQMDPSCFISFLGKYSLQHGNASAERILSIVQRYCQIHGELAPAIFHFLAQKKELLTDEKAKDACVRLWYVHNGPVQATLAELENQGKLNLADTLYQDWYALSVLSSTDLLRWAHIKEVLGDYIQAATLICTCIAHEDKNYLPVIHNQLLRMIEENGVPDTQQRIIAAYRTCLLSQPKIDSLWVSQSLADLYGRFSLFHQQVDAVVSLDNNLRSKAERLYGIAQSRFLQHLYELVIEPARLCLGFTRDDRLQRECAALLYETYIQIGNADSALVWYEKTGKNDRRANQSAVLLYQKKALFPQADSIISRLAESVEKDTLFVRQLLFQQEAKKAAIMFQNAIRQQRWKALPVDRYLWMLRLGVFNRDQTQAGVYFDSLHTHGFAFSWIYASEILCFSIAYEKLQDYQDAFEAWCSVQYRVYIDKTDTIPAQLKTEYWPDHIRQFILASYADALIQKQAYERAHNVLMLEPDSTKNTQLLFYKGLVEFKVGDRAKAKKIFEAIVVNDPENVFAHKARIYLLKLKQQI